MFDLPRSWQSPAPCRGPSHGSSEAPSRRFGAATWPQGAGVTVSLARSIEQRLAIIHTRPCRGQRLATGANINVASWIIVEVLPREGAVFARRFVEHGHMRLDAVFIDPAM